MSNEGDYYSYVACYFDDLIVVHTDPDHVFDSIKGKIFTIQEKFSAEYFLGRNFERVKDTKSDNKIITWISKTYVKPIVDNLKNKFGLEPNNKYTATPPNYNPQLDITDLYNHANKDQYWQCINYLQSTVALGRIDTMYANFVLYQFILAPHKYHFDKTQYLCS